MGGGVGWYVSVGFQNTAPRSTAGVAESMTFRKKKDCSFSIQSSALKSGSFMCPI